MIITCPYCGEEFEIPDYEVHDMINGNNDILDYECPYCEKTMDISVELAYTGEASEIIKQKCDCCGKDEREGKLLHREYCSPYPIDKKYQHLCKNCYQHTLYRDLDARRDHPMKYKNDDVKNIKNKYTPGMKLRVNEIKDPYRLSVNGSVVEVVCVQPDGSILCIVPNETYPSLKEVRLLCGFDVFCIEDPKICSECQKPLAADGRCYNIECKAHDPISQYFDPPSQEDLDKDEKSILEFINQREVLNDDSLPY